MLTREMLSDPVALTRALVDVESVSGNEDELATRVAGVLPEYLSVERIGNVVLARTDLGRAQRVVLAGHLDTVPLADNFPSTVDGEVIHGCGTSDMKSGVALMLYLAGTVPAPRYDVTYLFYDCEEIEAARNGLYRLAKEAPEKLKADFAILLEPTYGGVEAGCQGTLRARVTTTGKRAHAARSWRGVNAIHAVGKILRTLEEYRPRTVTIDGCEYREGVNAVRINGGVAGNVIPDECVLEVNYRFAPDRSEEQAADHLRDLFGDGNVEVTDSAPGALPGLTAAPAVEFVAAVGEPPRAKFGWTDVARFAAMGVPALNFGPGDPNLAHTREEQVEIPKIEAGAATLRRWLVG